MNKHTKPFTDAQIKQVLRAKPDDAYDEFNALYKTVENIPENRMSRRVARLMLALLSAIVILIVVAIILERGG